MPLAILGALSIICYYLTNQIKQNDAMFSYIMYLILFAKLNV
jgi:hypothetical protein